MFCLPFMAHTGSDMFLFGRLRNTMTTPLWFPNVCTNVSVCKLTRGRNERSDTLFAYSKEHARMGVVEMQVQSGNSQGHKH